MQLAKPMLWKWLELKCREALPMGYGTLTFTVLVNKSLPVQVSLEKVSESFREDRKGTDNLLI